MSRHRLGPAFGFDDRTRHHRLSRELAVSWVLMHVNGVGFLLLSRTVDVCKSLRTGLISPVIYSSNLRVGEPE